MNQLNSKKKRRKDRKCEQFEKEMLQAAYESDPIALLEDGEYELLDAMVQTYCPNVGLDEEDSPVQLDENGDIPF